MTKTAVWFNDEIKAKYDDLIKEGFTSQSFHDFVRTAFHDKMDNLRAKRLDLSNKTIEGLFYEVMKKNTPILPPRNTNKGGRKGC